MPMSTFSSMDDKFVIIPDLDTGNNQIALTSEAWSVSFPYRPKAGYLRAKYLAIEWSLLNIRSLWDKVWSFNILMATPWAFELTKIGF